VDASTQALFSLTGRTAVVVGASRGLGAAIARALAGAGATVLATGRSAQPQEALGASVSYTTCDALDQSAMVQAIDAFVAGHGGLDVYVHSAGVTLPGSESTLQGADAFAQTIETNLLAAFRGCEIAAARMKARGRGSIITITSIGSVLGFPGNPGYVAAKGGLRVMTKALARDLAPFGIRANCLAPGYMRTAMTEGSYTDPAKNAERLQRMMLPRWGTPQDLAGAAIFLASDASAYVTGIDLFVDGGWTAKGL
jgi:NAD(P)-dependent dehydrogenase (short-subunit alcohol dehydrogenase family)